jgi:HAE1 family hydrophobic/amphiphilic exporter-1/multidrug efflux pump
MGVVIVGGTIFSLVLTLFVIPAIYMMWSREKKHRPELDRAEEYEREAVEHKVIKHEAQ